MATRSRTGSDNHDAVQGYLDTMPREHREIADRIRRLVAEACPDALPGISYKMLCWRTGNHRLYLGSWKHGLSIYGWSQGREVAVTDRHPELKTSKGTIQLTPAAAAAVTDAELRSLIHAALDD
jgi:uncharacterized protein YdhG (YjbR/CyaY superfamily)